MSVTPSGGSVRFRPLASPLADEERMLGRMAVESAEEPGTLLIEAGSKWKPVTFAELRQYKGLLYFMAQRDVKVRYKQTFFGVAWAVIQPLFAMLVFSLFFGRLAGIPSDGVPYSLFVYTALVPWTFFSSGVVSSTGSLVKDAALVTKIYFPRLILPVAPILAVLVDFFLAFMVLLGMMVYYSVIPTWSFLAVPGLVILVLCATVGVGLWLSSLNAQFRDVGYVIPFLVQFWLFLTPIAYPTSLLNESWKNLYAVNPMVGVVEGFRWSLLGTVAFPGRILLISTLVAILVLVTGMYYFRKTERVFADVV